MKMDNKTNLHNQIVNVESFTASGYKPIFNYLSVPPYILLIISEINIIVLICTYKNIRTFVMIITNYRLNPC